MPTEPAHEIPSLRQAFHQFSRLVRLIRPYWTPLVKGMALALVLRLVGLVTPLHDSPCIALDGGATLDRQDLTSKVLPRLLQL